MNTTYENHIRTLQAHGARIAMPDGSIELTADFYHKAIEACVRGGCKAITYEMILPGIDEEMALCVWKDGRVDSGSVKSICDCLASY